MQFWDYLEKLPGFWSVQLRRLSERAVDTRNCLKVKCVSPAAVSPGDNASISLLSHKELTREHFI